MMTETTITAPKGYMINERDLKNNKITFIKIEEKLPKSWAELKKLKEGWIVNECGNVEKLWEDDSALDTGHSDCFLVWPTLKETEASVALTKLCHLRDVYNGERLEDWCDWNNGTDKFCIVGVNNCFVVATYTNYHNVLTFKTMKLRDEFFSCPEIKALLEKAKPLL